MTKTRPAALSAAKKVMLSAGLLLGAAFFAWVYYRVDPVAVGWMPRCPFRWLTGWQCPACGNQRALHAMLHGQWAAAFAFNPFLILSLPYVAALAVATPMRQSRPRLYAAVAHPRVVRAYAVLVCLWWVGRNLLPPC